jgi:cyclopropane fatty-acyl-phospholipid synthase-like methyltransferase
VLLGACGTSATVDPIGRRGSVDRYVAMLERPERDGWQKPRELVEALAIAPGSTVADVGTGSGYFLPYLVEAVPGGTIVAQDIDAGLLEHVAAKIAREGWRNVETRLGTADDPGLEEGRYDLLLMVDVFHHVREPVAFLEQLRDALAPCGRIAIADFPPGDSIPTHIAGTEHRIARERAVGLAREAGLEVVREHDFIRYQFVLELRRVDEACDSP